MPRKPGFRHIDETRAKIRATQLINRLQMHVEAGEPILDASQVNAAKALLNKVLPDLKAVELYGRDGGAIETRDIGKMSDDELSRIAAEGSAGVTEA